MRVRGLVFSLILLSAPVGFSATENKEKVLKAHPVSGLCSLKERKEKENCPLDLPEEPAREFSYFDFSAQESKKVKTTTAPCAAKLVGEILTLASGGRESGASSEKVTEKAAEKIAEKNQGPRFDPEACTILTKGPLGPQLALLELREFEMHSVPAPEILQRRILLVALDSKGQPEKILRRLLSVDASGAEKSLYSLQGICDVDGDQQADIVLNEELAHTSHHLIYNFKTDFKELSEKKYLASGGCSLAP